MRESSALIRLWEAVIWVECYRETGESASAVPPNAASR
jgi:hypothetical protein